MAAKDRTWTILLWLDHGFSVNRFLFQPLHKDLGYSLMSCATLSPETLTPCLDYDWIMSLNSWWSVPLHQQHHTMMSLTICLVGTWHCVTSHPKKTSPNKCTQSPDTCIYAPVTKNIFISVLIFGVPSWWKRIVVFSTIYIQKWWATPWSETKLNEVLAVSTPYIATDKRIATDKK